MYDLKEAVIEAIQAEWERRHTPHGPEVLDSRIVFELLADEGVEVLEEEKARILEGLRNEDRLYMTPIHGGEGWFISAPGRALRAP